MTRKEVVDACVVGAGPSGSIAAERLAHEGYNVLLLDAQRFPRYKCCAAGVLWHDLEDFPEVKPVIETYNYKLVAHSPSLAHEFSIESGDHYLMGQTYRNVLDAHLAGLARKAGATFRDRTRVLDVALMDVHRGISLQVKDLDTGEISTVECKLIIGADGVTSVVRKRHPDFRPWAKGDLLIASELDVPMDENEILRVYGKERAVHMFLYYGNLPGYAWIFTKKRSVSLGMGTFLDFKGTTIGGQPLSRTFDDYTRFLIANGYVPADRVDTGKTSFALIPSTAPRASVTFGRNALLAGDAAGAFVSALSGEGIYYGMLSGSFAAKAGIDALRSNDFSARMLSRYRDAWMARLKHELNYQYFAKGYMVEVKRRCEKAIRWGMHDETIRKFMSVFFTGVYQIDRSFMARLIGHYTRLKIKDRLGMLGTREKKSDYIE